MEAAQHGDTVWHIWNQRLEQIRHTAAELIAAKPSEVAFVANTTAGISLVAEGIDWRPGDNVVTLAREFPSNQYPWMNLASRGVATRRITLPNNDVPLDAIAQACDERTRLVSISWVDYGTGFRIDPAEVSNVVHDCGALFFLDAIQGLGVFPLDVHAAGVDFLAADGHKWMLGPEGAGLMYIRQDLLDALRPLNVGWNSVANKDFKHIELKLKPSAERYEGGSPNSVGVLGLGASLDLLKAAGLSATSSRVGERVLEITDFACDRLTEAGATVCSDRRGDCRSGIVSLEMPGIDPKEVVAAALEQRIALSTRSGRIRLSAHCYNHEEEIERLAEFVQGTLNS